MRFSLKWMLAAVAFVGIGCVALYNANEAWAMAAFSFTVIVLLVGLVGAIHSKSFCAGVCVFGWGYLLLTYVPPFGEVVKPLAATNALLDIVYVPMRRDVPINPNALPEGHRSVEEFQIQFEKLGGVKMSDVFADAVPEGARIRGSGPGFVYELPIQKQFRAIGHLLFALIFAIIGGLIGQWFSRCNTASER